MLHRVIYASEAVGVTGTSTLSIAQILGVSGRNNARDGITGCIMFHRGHILQAVEGRRGELDRLIRRLLDDRRHTGMRILIDTPIQQRAMSEPMTLCADSQELLSKVGLTSIAGLTPSEAEELLELAKAA